MINRGNMEEKDETNNERIGDNMKIDMNTNKIRRILVGGLLATSLMLYFMTLIVIAQPATEDPFNVINSVDMEKDNHKQSAIDKKNFWVDNSGLSVQKPDKVNEPKHEKLHPMIKKWIADKKPSDNVDILINLREDITIPRLIDQSNTRPQTTQEIEKIHQKRKNKHESFAKNYEKSGLKIKESFWLTNGFLAEVSVSAINKIAEDNDVTYIQPQFGGEMPPADTNPYNDVDDGRYRIQSDPYYNGGLTNGYIGLLDTGVRQTHTLFINPDHIDYVRDCVNGGPSCNDNTLSGFNTDDLCSHGTSTSAIMTGNGNLGNSFRGITAITLDSWRVYNGCGLDGVAVVRAFQNAVWSGDGVIVAEMQAGEAENGIIATTADNAYDAGSIIIAANGNYGPNAGTVASPAIAHKVIGVGAYDVQSLLTPSYQSRGPATDGRYKPDIQTPTNTETASTTSDTALRVFGGTSGATPYGAGAAALTRNWLSKFNTYDPGQTYARLILSGQRNGNYDNEEGVGDLKLPTNGWSFWGKVSISGTGSVVDIPITMAAEPGFNPTKVEAALWWPEAVSESHDDIDLYILDPTNNVKASAVSGVSVFERASASGTIVTGNWIVRIKGFSVPSGPQTVYWTARFR